MEVLPHNLHLKGFAAKILVLDTTTHLHGFSGVHALTGKPLSGIWHHMWYLAVKVGQT